MKMQEEGRNQRVVEIIESIAESCGVPDIQATVQLTDDLQLKKLSECLTTELDIQVTPSDLLSCLSTNELAKFIESRLPFNKSGKTEVDLYLEVEELARQEYHPKIRYGWCAKWSDFLDVGNFLTKPDQLDSVEILMRLENKYGIQIPDQDAQKMSTVGQTIRYIWETGNHRSISSATADQKNVRYKLDIKRRIQHILLQRIFG